MAIKVKGICKGFKFFTQIFVFKEREMEIGLPTDVKHVAHIGWDGPSGTPPSWMSQFKTAPSFSTTSSFTEARDLNSHDFSPLPSQGSSSGRHESTLKESPASVVSNSNGPKKHRRKKIKSISPTSSSSPRHYRASKPKATIFQAEATTAANAQQLTVA